MKVSPGKISAYFLPLNRLLLAGPYQHSDRRPRLHEPMNIVLRRLPLQRMDGFLLRQETSSGRAFV